MAILKSVKDQLQTVKNNVQDFHEWFEPNYKRFNFFRKFVFETSLSAADIASLSDRGMPQLEFNILEAMISKLRAEFARQEPSLTVLAVENAHKIDPQMMKTIEGYTRAIIANSNMDNLEYDIFTDQLGGGFSVLKVFTDYIHPKAFDQNIYLKRAFDPTLCGFDKNAQRSHKGDGQYCFELYPKQKDEFESKYGSKYCKSMRFSRSTDLYGFNWSYQSQMGDEVVLMGDYYSKKITKKRMVKLLTGDVMEENKYEEFAEKWNQMNLTQAPTVIGTPKEADFVTICRFVVVENDIIDYQETDYEYLPLIFVDGNSITLRDNNGSTRQVTRPYVYHAQGIQRLKNYAGISLANELENTVQHKFAVQKEAIPVEYKDAYINIQKASTLIYNGFREDDPSIPLQPPIPIPRVPAPPEITNTFTISDEVTRSILGNYDMALNNPTNQLSGKAIFQGALQSNASSGPYLVSYIKAWNRVGQLILDLIPKYITTPRTIGIKNLNGKYNYQQVNDQNSISLDYDPYDLEIRIEAGVNFETQRAQSFEMLNKLMQTMPILNEYISTDINGIEMLLDNVDIRGIDSLKENIAKFVEEKKQQQQQQMQMQQQQMQMQMQMLQQNNPAVIKQAELKQNEQKIQIDAHNADRKLDIEQQKVDLEKIKTIEELNLEHEKNIVAAEKINAQNLRSDVDLQIKKLDTKHGHAMDILTLHHNKTKNESTVEVKTI